MRKEDFFEILGDMDESIVKGAEKVMRTDGGNEYGRYERVHRLRGAAATAAVAALMVCSFLLGAVAFAKETVVEVPVEQEMIDLSGIGLKVILPEEWRGKYEVVMDENRESCRVYVKEIRDRNNWAEGHLFAVDKVWTDGPLTVEEFIAWRPIPANYLFSTAEATYMLSMPSDVQYDEEGRELYMTMYRQIKDISFQISNPAAIDG